MSVSIQTPPSSDVVSSYNSRLSPPPTPVAKRGCHFFESNDDTIPQVPTFFPSSNSIMTGHLLCLKDEEEDIKEEENVERRLLNLLASRPTPTIRLKPRPTSSIHNVMDTEIPPPEDTCKKQVLTVNMNEIKPLPIYSPSSFAEPKRSIESMIRKLPSLSSDSETKTIPTTRKLPSFQRGGIHRHTTKRRNSIVARSA